MDFAEAECSMDGSGYQTILMLTATAGMHAFCNKYNALTRVAGHIWVNFLYLFARLALLTVLIYPRDSPIVGIPFRQTVKYATIRSIPVMVE